MWKDWKRRNFGENYSEKITIKKIMRVQSRKDLRDGLKPTPLRLLLLAAVLLVMLFVGNRYFTKMREAQEVSATPKGDNEIQISFVGDVCLGRYVQEYGDSNGYDALFSQASKIWRNSDLVFANLECVILEDSADTSKVKSQTVLLSGNQKGLTSAVNSGINVWSLANNHVLDYGEDGIRFELEALKQQNAFYAGAGTTREEANKGQVIDCDGFLVGFVSFVKGFKKDDDGNGYFGTETYVDFYKQIREYAESTDLVVVYVHWGAENIISADEEQIELGHRLIEAGADIVIGSHPHVLQSVEQYQNGVICYSLGNFVFDQGLRTARNTVMVQLNLDRESRGGELVLIPMRIDDFAPHVTYNRFYQNSIRRTLLKQLSKDAYSITEDGRVHIPVSFR